MVAAACETSSFLLPAAVLLLLFLCEGCQWTPSIPLLLLVPAACCTSLCLPRCPPPHTHTQPHTPTHAPTHPHPPTQVRQVPAAACSCCLLRVLVPADPPPPPHPRYAKFLLLRKARLDLDHPVPCADVALMWHTHRSVSGTYAGDCMALLGRLFEDMPGAAVSGEGSSGGGGCRLWCVLLAVALAVAMELLDSVCKGTSTCLVCWMHTQMVSIQCTAPSCSSEACGVCLPAGQCVCGPWGGGPLALPLDRDAARLGGGVQG
jgi:hypothetical protein